VLVNKLTIFVSVFAIFCLGFAGGFIVSGHFFSNTQTAENYEVRSASNRFTNPLLQCEYTEAVKNKELNNLEKELTIRLSDIINNPSVIHVSVYYRDLNNGPWIGINEKETFAPGSLFKVPLLIAYMRQLESDPSLSKKKITYSQRMEFENQNILPEEKLVIGNEYLLEDLVRRMIIYSDNEAKDLVYYAVDPKIIDNVFADFGINITDPISVKTYASFFRVLYNASYLNRESSEKALQLLSQIRFKQGLVAGVPQNIPVAHKFGERRLLDASIQLHDCGIIYLPKKPYLLCIMTKGKSLDQLAAIIKEVSQKTYENISNTVKK
jgi:beta-lactamase class A